MNNASIIVSIGSLYDAIARNTADFSKPMRDPHQRVV
jgi:hypothetical protein